MPERLTHRALPALARLAALLGSPHGSVGSDGAVSGDSPASVAGDSLALVARACLCCALAERWLGSCQAEP